VGRTTFVRYEPKELEQIPKSPSQLWERELKDSLEHVGLTKDALLDIYRRMLIARYFEVRGYGMFFEGKIPGYFHSGAGQEAVAFGAIEALHREDYVVSNYRGHVHMIAKGGDLGKIMAEILGKATGFSKGKGGSMYVIDIARGFLYSSGIVCATLPVAVGVGLAIRLAKEDKVVLSFIGEGAVSEGEFHESLNLASLWKLPVIFLVENNKYAITTNTKRAISTANIASKASGYDMPGYVVDGMDLINVYSVIKEVVEKARSGGGPSLVEALVYRFHGHTRWDPAYGIYRSKELLEWHKSNDPIERLERFLEAVKWISKGDTEKYKNEAVEAVEKSIKYAEESPYPNLDEAYTDVYADYPVYGGTE